MLRSSLDWLKINSFDFQKIYGHNKQPIKKVYMISNYKGFCVYSSLLPLYIDLIYQDLCYVSKDNVPLKFDSIKETLYHSRYFE